MDRGSGTLSKQMADFVIVCIIRQYTRASAKKSEKGEGTCGLSLYPPLISLSACFSMHMSFVCPSFCMSVALRLLLVPLRLCTEEHVIVAIFRLNTSS